MRFGAPQQCSLGVAACYLVFMLTCALLMTSSHSEGKGGMAIIDREQLYPKPKAPQSQPRSSDYVESHWRPSPEEEGEDE